MRLTGGGSGSAGPLTERSIAYTVVVKDDGEWRSLPPGSLCGHRPMPSSPSSLSPSPCITAASPVACPDEPVAITYAGRRCYGKLASADGKGESEAPTRSHGRWRMAQGVQSAEDMRRSPAPESHGRRPRYRRRRLPKLSLGIPYGVAIVSPGNFDFPSESILPFVSAELKCDTISSQSSEDEAPPGEQSTLASSQNMPESTLAAVESAAPAMAHCTTCDARDGAGHGTVPPVVSLGQPGVHTNETGQGKEVGLWSKTEWTPQRPAYPGGLDEALGDTVEERRRTLGFIVILAPRCHRPPPWPMADSYRQAGRRIEPTMANALDSTVGRRIRPAGDQQRLLATWFAPDGLGCARIMPPANASHGLWDKATSVSSRAAAPRGGGGYSSMNDEPLRLGGAQTRRHDGCSSSHTSMKLADQAGVTPARQGGRAAREQGRPGRRHDEDAGRRTPPRTSSANARRMSLHAAAECLFVASREWEAEAQSGARTRDGADSSSWARGTLWNSLGVRTRKGAKVNRQFSLRGDAFLGFLSQEFESKKSSNIGTKGLLLGKTFYLRRRTGGATSTRRRNFEEDKGRTPKLISEAEETNQPDNEEEEDASKLEQQIGGKQWLAQDGD
nr:unnamed protein product [Digitaria exilis]